MSGILSAANPLNVVRRKVAPVLRQWEQERPNVVPGILAGVIESAPIFEPTVGQAVGGTGRAILGSELFGAMQQMEADPTRRTDLIQGMLSSPVAYPVVAPIKPDAVLALGRKPLLPTTPEFQEAVKNTPGATLTDDGLRLSVARRQVPGQGGELSVRTGVFYLPAGDPRLARGYTGRSGYGGPQHIEGETLVQNPLFVKGATGGKAPQAAYDQIMGKGAYEAMRTDVLAAARNFVEPMAEKAKRVAAVLEKYGADPGLALDIVRNSRGGNLLPYAVQENIVAHAVRKAGYDSVLGYTKNKSGLALSELFDVRETTYPSTVLNPQIHPRFTEGQ